MNPSSPADMGETLEKTAAAFALGDEQEVLPALVHAFLEERLLVPVKPAPHQSGEPHGSDDSCPPSSLRQAKTPLGPAIVAFTSVDLLTLWDETARPLSVPGPRLALAALAETQGLVLLNPPDSGLILGRPALTALASGDTWLPPWRDVELINALVDQGSRWPSIEGVTCVPTLGGGLLIEVEINGNGGAARDSVEGFASSLKGMERLFAAAHTVEIRPRWSATLSFGHVG
ncbi:MAG: SseB family protein [Actinomycetaceae bacterium]|nr:SseB family protein [Actinomycetaceae bacterium]